MPGGELLVENLRRIAHLRGALAQELRVLGQQRVGPQRPLERAPLASLQAPAHGLAIQLKAPRQRPDRQPLISSRPPQRLPQLLPNHRSLPRIAYLGRHGPTASPRLFGHRSPSSERGVGIFQ